MRVALVTGAARGIGAATTARLASLGYHVLAIDWCLADSAEVLPEHLPYPMAGRLDLDSVASHPNVEAVVADVRDFEKLREAVDYALQRWGRLDAAVAAAAVIAGGKSLWCTPAAELHMLWEIDVLGVWNTAAAAVPAMLDGPDPSGCRFVAIASTAASHGLHNLAGYNTVKHAVVGLIKGLAADLVGTGVTAVAVSPGSTRTPMLEATASLYGLPDTAAFADHQLLYRLLEPEEVAATIAFCCSPEGGMLNGSVVRADGGFSP